MNTSRDKPTARKILPHNSAYCFVRSSPTFSASAPPLSSSRSSYADNVPSTQDPYNPQFITPIHRQSLTDEGLSHPFGVPSVDPNQVTLVEHVVHYVRPDTTGGGSLVSLDARRLGAYHRCNHDTHSHVSSVKHRRH